MGVLVESFTYVTPRQWRIIDQIINKENTTLSDIAKSLGVKPEDLMRDVSELESKNLVKTEKKIIPYYVLTETAEKYLKHGFPEEKVYEVLKDFIQKNIDELIEYVVEKTNMTEEDVQIGIQYLVKNKCIIIEKKKISTVDQDKCVETLNATALIRKKLNALEHGELPDVESISLLKRRKLIEQRDKVLIILKPTEKLLNLWTRGLLKERTLVTVVKPEYAMELEKYLIKEFDLTIEPPSPPLSKKHPFMQFIDELREIMISMGFEEVKGPHVEAELWNFDALFQAQDHPAREIHDTFFIKNTMKASPPQDILERAKSVHETGWKYKWNPERAIRLVLRSQTTAVTARAIYERGPGEYRVFTIDRNFRPENLDAKHSMEFYQLDGVIVGKNVNFKHLLYFFKELAAALGIKEVWFKPGYFPFTEPSVEGYVKHQKLGWIEVFPGGVFRPEVMEILGAKGYNAIAWGIGVDRLAMTVLGIDDIRLLFTRDLNVLQSIKYVGLPYFTRRTSGQYVKVVPVPL
ncbi:MAG: phenylalanine--tRNA ligase subunit alpha [Desulfurococcaceae archaeon]